MKRTRDLLVFLALLALATARAGPARAGGGQAAGGALAPAGSMAPVVRRYDADETSLRRFYDEPLSELRLDRMARFLADWRKKLQGIDFDHLDVEDRVDWVLLRKQIQRREDELALQRQRNQETLVVLGLVPDLLTLDRARWRPSGDQAPRAMAATLMHLREELAAARHRVQVAHDKGKDAPADAPRLTPVIAWRAAHALDRLQRRLKSWYGFFHDYDPSFAWWVDKPHAALAKAMGDYATYLRRKVAGIRDGGDPPLMGDPIGRDALRRALAREMIPYSPEQLLAIAEAQMAWCRTQAEQVAKDLGQDSWKAALEKVKGMQTPPGGQAAYVAKMAQQAVDFVRERELVTVPPLCAETWRVRMISERAQKTLPFAVYNDQHMLVAYATEGMPYEAKLMSMRGNNAPFMRTVVPHELIPGHHLQLFQAARHRPWRSLFRTAFLVEGWAFYWETMLWDLGWPRTPAERAGMLFWRMHRCARVIVTVSFHLGRMTPKQMVDTLVQRVGMERDGATSEVRRYIGGGYGPLYQCAYLLGGLQLRALHHELVGDGRLSDRDFHDAILRQGPIPVEMVRAALEDQNLARDHEASWRWQGDVAVGAKPK